MLGPILDVTTKSAYQRKGCEIGNGPSVTEKEETKTSIQNGVNCALLNLYPVSHRQTITMSDTSREISKERYHEDAEPGKPTSGDNDWISKGDPFGDESNAEVKYRTLTWWQTSLLMIAETVSLGILSLPSVLAAIGLVPGVILLATLGAAATYTGYVYGQFKVAYPHVANMADAGEVLMGGFGREFVGTAQVCLEHDQLEEQCG